MADQQRYSEEEVYSILREAVRIPGSEAQSGFTRDQIARFAADAGISEEALEQSLAKHKGRRRAKLLEYSRKTTLTLDWELSQAEIDGIAGLCEALPPYAYKSMGNYATIRIDQWGFYSIVSILRNDGFTHISIDRQGMLGLETALALFCLWGLMALVVASYSKFFLFTPSDPFLIILPIVGFVYWARVKHSLSRRKKLAELIADELHAELID
jgi:hypothetical protein